MQTAMQQAAVTPAHRQFNIEGITRQQGFTRPMTEAVVFGFTLVKDARPLAEDFIFRIAKEIAEAAIASLQQTIANENDTHRRMVEDRQHLGHRHVQVHRLLLLRVIHGAQTALWPF
jgi:hypothetical protein